MAKSKEESPPMDELGPLIERVADLEQSFANQEPDPMIESLTAQVMALTEQLEQMKKEQTAVVLKSPIDGNLTFQTCLEICMKTMFNTDVLQRANANHIKGEVEKAFKAALMMEESLVSQFSK